MSASTEREQAGDDSVTPGSDAEPNPLDPGASSGSLSPRRRWSSSAPPAISRTASCFLRSTTSLTTEQLPERIEIIGVARRDKEDEDFQQIAALESIEKLLPAQA